MNDDHQFLADDGLQARCVKCGVTRAMARKWGVRCVTDQEKEAMDRLFDRDRDILQELAKS